MNCDNGIDYFIGIDPSMNSTGICIQKYQENTKVNESFHIVTHKQKLNKKETAAQNSILYFDYDIYKYEDLSVLKNYDMSNHEIELAKTKNMMSCASKIYEIIKEETKNNLCSLAIVLEGISYGSSIRTKSIFDLAGLNYLIREKILKMPLANLTIAPPSEIKKFASGNGNCKKDAIVELFIAANPSLSIIPKVDDIADAWFMANFAKHIKMLL